MRAAYSFVAGMVLALGLATGTPGMAQEERSTAPYAYRQLDDPAKEEQAQDLMETLRCLQCQGQSIADSDAPIAGSMRSLVRERIAAGEEPEAIRSWLIERYGDYVSILICLRRIARNRGEKRFHCCDARQPGMGKSRFAMGFAPC